MRLERVLLLHCHSRSSLRCLGAAGHDPGAGVNVGGIVHHVGVVRGGPDPDMAQQPVDHRQALAEGESPRGTVVPYVI